MGLLVYTLRVSVGPGELRAGLDSNIHFSKKICIIFVKTRSKKREGYEEKRGNKEKGEEDERR
jgi:hypothetical protein